jgi:hydroxypyruvate isomerase
MLVVKLSVCIEMLWGDLPYEERIRRVAALGFPAFEFWGWRQKDLNKLRAAMDTYGLAASVFGLDPFGKLVQRDAQAQLVQAMRESAAVAKQLGVRTLIVTTGNTLEDESFEATRRRAVRHLRALAPVAEDAGITLCVEPLNTLVDHHGYWLARMSEAVDIVEEVDSPAIKVLMDIYHQQVQEGNIIANLTAYSHHIGHFHSAGVPGRHELVGGELDYRAIFKAIDATGYAGYVGLEFSPTKPAEQALKETLGLL